MMQDEGSRLDKPVRRQVWRTAALGAAFACGCATGVDVTDDELAAICADPTVRCNGVISGSGGSGGAVGNTGGRGGGSSVGGTFSTTGGTGGSNNNTGGTGSGTGGSGPGGGAGGTAGTGSLPPLAEGECLATSDVTIVYSDQTNGSASVNQPRMYLGVQNGGDAFPLSDLTIRYWFTADGASGFTGNIDYAEINGQTQITGQVSVGFGQESGSDYAEVSFSSTETIDAGGVVEEVQVRFGGANFPQMQQTNDFSFLASAPAGTPNPNVTPYLNGVQVGGCVPSP
jgi:hypothetical protein